MEHTRPDRSPEAEPGYADRPRLRGWLHGLMVPVAIVGTVILVFATRHLPALQRVPALLFGAVLVLLYTTSSLYHVPRRWGPAARTFLCRCDGAATVLLIVGTFVSIAYYTLEGAWQTWTVAAAAAVALVGTVVAASSLHVPRWAAATAYIAVGWLCAVPVGMIARRLPVTGTVLIAVGGALYTLGAVVFARRRPDPSPRWFGYHEIFHVLVSAASVVHFIAVWRFVLPMAA